MIVIVDYGMCNVGSIVNMLKKTGAQNIIASNKMDMIKNAEKIIIPGVGSYDAGVKKLKELEVFDAIKEEANNGKPVLGICLGMQLLGNSSEEGSCCGFGLIDFECKKLNPGSTSQLRVPHMGWEYVNVNQKSDSFVQGLNEDARFYFVHSYYPVCSDINNVMMSFNYGGQKISCAVHKDNIYGTQFHPEKSHKYGYVVFKNFVENC